MIIVLVFLLLIVWSHWLVFRGLRSARATTPLAAPGGRPDTSNTTAFGLEDDPGQWRATCGAWTALDERQLIRLLTESAP